jgi:ABC-2 type transport system ATP-binding protein
LEIGRLGQNGEAVRVVGLCKRYGGDVAVDSIDFAVRQGEIFGLLGPNGAGKTTTLECLEGLREPDAGTLRIMGIDPVRDSRKLRNVTGVQLQTSALPDSMCVDEALRFFSSYHGVMPDYGLLERLGLAEKRRAQYRSLSTGQKRRLTLALALAHGPTVVLLDEPTAGLDVGSRIALHAVIQELRSAGTTFILATHDMAEAEKLADRVAVLLRGKLVVSGTPRELTAAGRGLTKISVRSERATLVQSGVALPAVERTAFQDEYAVYYSQKAGQTVTAAIAQLEASDDPLVDLRVERPSLEERFLELTGKGDSR